MAKPKKKKPAKKPAKRVKAKKPAKRSKAPKKKRAKAKAAPKKRAKAKAAPKKAKAAPKKKHAKAAPKKKHAKAKAPKKKTNARRLHPRWFDPIAARKHGELPRVEMNAAYWRAPARARHANVQRLLRGGSRKKRAAIAIARAEQRHADAPPRKSNPGMSDGQALAEYRKTHWGERGRATVRAGHAPNPEHGTLTKMGRLVAVVYRTTKGGDDGPTDYEHEFEGPLPTLAYNDGGLVVVGGGYKIGEEGIDR